MEGYPRNAVLCGPCCDIFADGSYQGGTFSENEYKIHHRDRQSIDNAIAMGCELCCRLKFEQGDLGSSTVYVHFASRHNHPNEPYSGSVLEVNSRDQDGNPVYLGWEFFHIYNADTFQLLPALQLAELSRQQDSTGSVEVLDLARHWFFDCLENHGASCSPVQDRWYPSRLLDITGEMVRLFTPDASTTKTSYGTVSYCWGTEPFFRLTVSTALDLQAGVGLTRFPPAFQDVFQVAKHLDIRFLWIDCYCILQSDKDSGDNRASEIDWERECRTIGKIYESSVLNIGLAHTGSPASKCFQNRTHQPSKACMIEWTPTPSGNKTTCYIDENRKEARGQRLFTKPLFTRGWVLQERLLCSRMLYFSNDQIYWECSAHEHSNGTTVDRCLKSESCPVALDSFDISWNLDQNPWSINGPDDAPMDDQWFHIANLYSATNLTYPNTDKLLALSGVAARTAAHNNDSYVTGMFHETIVPHLCWRIGRQSDRKAGRRSTAWRAPSWSWLSVDGPIYCRTPEPDESIELAMVTDIRVELQDPQNAFGALKSASLQLYCRPLATTFWKEGVRMMVHFGESQQANFYVDDAKELDAAAGREILLVPLILQVASRLGSGWQTYSPGVSRHRLEALQEALREEIQPPGDIEYYMWCGLVLQKLEGDDCVYQRLGIAFLEERSPDFPYSEILRQLLQVDEKVLTLV